MAYLPPPSKEILEDLTAQILPKVFGSIEPATIFGRSGQTQDGVDVVLRGPDGLIGAQCKAYQKKKLTVALLAKELQKAHGFEPPLSRYIIVTCAPRDAELHKWALASTINGQLNVQIWFWDDLCAFLEEHDLIGSYVAKAMPARVLIAGFKALGMPFPAISTSDAGAPAPDIDDPDAQELENLMASGRAHLVVARLSNQSRPTESQQFLLARAYLQLRLNDDARIALIGCSAAKALALMGLVNARQKDERASQAAIAQAFHRADETSNGYIAGMAISCHVELHSDTNLQALTEIVPENLREHASVLSSLGDAASQMDLHAEAIAYYRAAEEKDGRSTALRRIAILANRLAVVLANLASGDLYASSESDRIEIQAVRVGLRSELDDSMDVRLRAATLHNLHVSALAMHDLEESLSAIRQAIDLEPNEPTLWRRWALASLVSESPVDLEFLARAPAEASLDLMLSQLEARSGNRPHAIARLDRALQTPSLEPSLEARLAAQRVVLDGEHDTLTPHQGEQLLTLAKTLRSPAPALVRLASAVDAPGMENVSARFFAWLEAAELEGLEEDDQLALVAALVERSHANKATRFLPLLRRRLTRTNGVIDAGIAPLLIQVLMSIHRFHEAGGVAERLVATGSAYGLYLKSLVLALLGDSGRALDELIATPALTSSAASLIRRCVELGIVTNRLREVQRLVRSLPLPRVKTAAQYSALYGSLVALKDPRRDDVAVDALQSGGFDDVAHSIFAHGLRGGREPPRRVSANALVTIQRDNGYRGEFWVGSGASPSDVAVATWLSPALGFEIGDSVLLTDGPFAGERVQIVATKRPEQVLQERALLAATQQGTVSKFSGTTDELVAKMREQLAEQAQQHAQTLSNASAHAIPASSMAEHFGKPARAFLRAEGHWIPKCHSGARTDMDAEMQVLNQTQRWVIDPASVCLIVECGLEDFFRGEGVRPLISAQACHVLRNWQLQETRTSRGSRGTMHLGKRGRLIFLASSAKARTSTRMFWRALWQFVQRCETGARVSDDVMASLTSWAEILDIGSQSSIALAKETGFTLLSDELTARRAAAELEVPSASLRGMVVRAANRKLVPVKRSVRAMAALAKTGRSFFSITTRMLVEAMQLPANERWTVIQALLGTLRTANPLSAWPMLLVALAYNTWHLSGSHRSRLNERALVRLILRMAPGATDEHVRGALILVAATINPRLARTWQGRRMRSLRRAMSHYLQKQSRRAARKKSHEAQDSVPLITSLIEIVDP